jgi:UDP-2,3-diacylglucosamine pyrophosphatase LpxH
MQKKNKIIPEIVKIQAAQFLPEKTTISFRRRCCMKIFVSDLHLGCGDALEDFAIWNESPPSYKNEKTLIEGMERMHKAFADFLKNISERDGVGNSPPELIFLGDTFDLLQVFPEDRRNPEKIHLIYKAHAPFFEALTDYHKCGAAVTLILGNHDHDLLHPALWDALKQHLPFINLSASGAPMLYYHSQEAGIYAEHGNQYDILNAFQKPSDPEEWTIGAELTLRFVNPLERTCPVIDNMGVREALWYAITQLPQIVTATQRKDLMLAEAIKGISWGKRLKHLAYFLLHQFTLVSDSSILNLIWRLLVENERLFRSGVVQKSRLSEIRRSFNVGGQGILYTFRRIGRNPLRILQEFLTDRLLTAAEKMMRGDVKETIGRPIPPPRFVAFGHTHQPRLKKSGDGRVYVNTGSWRMRTRPYGRLSFRFEQTLDYAILTCNKKGIWCISLNRWKKES